MGDILVQEMATYSDFKSYLVMLHCNVKDLHRLQSSNCFEMASDLKIEIFAYNVFSGMFRKLDKIKPNIFQIYEDEICKINNYAEACDKMFLKAILCRFVSFKTLHLKVLPIKRVKSLKSLADCYDYVCEICDRNDLFGHLTVFERMFSTLALVASLCLRIYYDNACNIDVFNYVHLLWTMYFEKFTEKFYKEGGWNKLKRVAQSYLKVSSCIDYVLRDCESPLNIMKEGFVNYNQFKNTTQFYKYKYVSKHWVKFHLDNFEDYFTVPFRYQYSVDAYEADVLLEDMKRLCHTTSEKCNTFDSFDGIKANSMKNPANEHLISERKAKINDIYNAELYKKCTEFENVTQNDHSFPDLEVISLDTTENYINLKSPDKPLNKANSVSVAVHSQNDCTPVHVKVVNKLFGTDIGEIFQKDIEKWTDLKKLHLDDSSENKSLKIEVFPPKNLSSKSIERQNYISSKAALSSKSGIPSLNHVCSPESFNPINGNVNNTNERLNIKDIDVISGQAESFSTDQIAECESSENTVTKYIPSTKCIIPKNKLSNTEYERQKVQNDTEDLRHQNEDFHLIDFCRMILVLGDRQGINYVRSTLHNLEDIQENSTKCKKRSKKKKQRV